MIRELDIRLFLRVPYETLKARREKRFGYHTQGELCALDPIVPMAVLLSLTISWTSLITDIVVPEGSFWVDPPGYWDDIVWPAYLKAHRDIFQNGDVSHGDAIPVDGTRNDDRQTRLSNDTTSKNWKTNQVEGTAPAEQPPSTNECGKPVPGLIVMPSSEITLEELFEASCRNILSRHEPVSN